MSDITTESINLEYLNSTTYQNYSFDKQIQITDYSNYSTLEEFDATIDTALPTLSLDKKTDSGDIYKSKGIINPESESPSLIIDESIKEVLVFTDSLVKQVGIITTEYLSRQLNVEKELTNLIILGVNAILGIATGGISFNLFSLVGTIFSAIGFSGIGNLISGLGGAKDNLAKVNEQQQKIAERIGKNLAASVKETQNILIKAEGLNNNIANVHHFSSNVTNFSSTTSVNIQSPLRTVAAGSSVETYTDQLLTSNYYQANHSYYTATIDNSYSYKTRHSTRYHSVSLVEIAAQAEYITSTLFNYADFRWTQTGQGLGAVLPITNPLDTLLNKIFTIKAVPLPGINIELSSLAKLTSASLFNMNYGQFYTIDGIVLINCGFGAGLGSIPYRQVSNISDISPPQTVDRLDPESYASMNNKTYETLYKENEKFNGLNLGQMFTKIKSSKTKE
jgi:hypothetical protein